MLLDRGLSVSTIKVCVAAILAQHALVAGQSVGSHPLVSRFLKGAPHRQPPHVILVHSWNLPVVL